MAKKVSSARASPAPAAKATTTTTTTTVVSTPSTTSTTPSTTGGPATSTTSPTSTSTPSLSNKSSPQDIAFYVINRYTHDTPSRTLLLDVFLAFLVLVGAVQFAYCILAGNYPFNAFLAGFGAATGQFVLTISLRLQTSEREPAGASSSSSSSVAAKKSSTAKTGHGLTGEIIEDGSDGSTTGSGVSKISSERAFADFVLGSLILHGFCVNFIN